MTAFSQFPPDMLVVRLGGNDLPKLPGKALILDIICDLKWLNAKYPTMQIVWYTIIPWLAKGTCWSSLRDSVAGMGHSLASPYPVVGNVEKTGISC